MQHRGHARSFLTRFALSLCVHTLFLMNWVYVLRGASWMYLQEAPEINVLQVLLSTCKQVSERFPPMQNDAVFVACYVHMAYAWATNQHVACHSLLHFRNFCDFWINQAIVYLCYLCFVSFPAKTMSEAAPDPKQPMHLVSRAFSSATVEEALSLVELQQVKEELVHAEIEVCICLLHMHISVLNDS